MSNCTCNNLVHRCKFNRGEQSKHRHYCCTKWQSLRKGLPHNNLAHSAIGSSVFAYIHNAYSFKSSYIQCHPAGDGRVHGDAGEMRTYALVTGDMRM